MLEHLQDRTRRGLSRTLLILLGGWTLIAACVLGLTYHLAAKEQMEIALDRAKDSFKKDLAYRKWASMRGGVYVRKDALTPPNPHLAFLPERDLRTADGKELTLVNPAYMTRMVHEFGFEQYGLRGHITSLHPIRPENAPDDWERQALLAFERGAREHHEVYREPGGKVLRYMGAFLVEESCLKCHAQQGYRAGEVRGGISVTVPVNAGPAAFGLTDNSLNLLSIVGFWVLGCTGIVLWVGKMGDAARSQQSLMQVMNDSARRFQAIEDTTPDGLWFVDREGRIVGTNDAYCNLVGYGRDELLGKPISMVEAVETQEDVRDRIRGFLESGRGARFRTRHRGKDGRLLDLEVTTTPLPSQGQVIAVLRDITHELQAAEQVRLSEAQFRQMFEASPVAMFIHRRGVVIQANSAAARLMDAAHPEQLEGQDLMTLVHPDYRELMEARIDQTLRHQRPSGATDKVLMSLQGRPVPVAMHAVLLDLPEEPAILAMAMDLTERREAEAEHRRLEAEVQHAQKLESLGSLAGGIAHDMNNVLTAIMGMSSLLVSKHRDEPGMLKSLQLIESAAERGRDLVKGLTDFARKGLEASRQVDVNALIRQEFDLLARTTRQRFAFDLQLEEGLPCILGDPSTLSSALMNLCVNAIDAMPKGGTLRVATAFRDGLVEVRVTDTGSGIPADILPRVTEPFFTTKPSGRGTGLGLAMVYGTMKAHGGTLEIQSQPGRGTTVTLRFPPSGAPAGAAQDAVESAVPQRPLHLLVVDDNELIRSILPEMLAQMGHQVDTASSGLEALRRLGAGLDPDVVILDHNMPGMSGAETLPRIFQLRPDVRVFVATGFMDNELRLLLADFPTVSTLLKPFTIDELRRALQEVRPA